MPNKKEINGKAVRDEVKLLAVSLLMGEPDYEAIAIHAGGFTTTSSESTLFTHFNLKQTEQKYMIAYLLKHSRYRWNSAESHQEGDNSHFGKRYELRKILETFDQKIE
ncbi:MAG: hypothetical protein WBL80_06895 [Erysipelotrichaceae bacterium]